MTINKDFFDPERSVNHDLQSSGKTRNDWTDAARSAERFVPTHCSFCGVQCAMYLRVKDDRVIGVEPRNYPHNRGSLCPKGVVAYQQADHPDRLLYPMIRRNGTLARASWDDALDLVATRWHAIQAEHGKDAVAVYSGSSMTNEKCYLMGKFARVALGTRHIDYNGRLCMSSAAGAYEKAFGLDRAAIPMPDIPLADVILVVGSNVAECFPVAMQWIWRARDRGARLIVVDPRETPIARTADLWLPIRPGGDVALLNAMLRILIDDGLVDETYVRDRTTGWDDVRAAAAQLSLEETVHITGIPATRIVAAARLYGRAATSLILHARGIEHSSHGVDNCLACINLALARGQVGKPGGGTMTLTGQGNGQGGREMGQKATQLPGYRHIDDPAARRYVADVWGIPEPELPGAGVSAPDMVRLMAGGQIKSCLVMCSNLMVSLPDNAVVQRALDALDPLVVVDFFMSETAERADVVLPCAVWCEDEGTTTNLEGRVVRLNQATEPPGEARRDWDIACDLAQRLGRGQFFPFRSVREIWDELRVATKGGIADYSGITYEKIDAQDGVFWPCPSDDSQGTPRLFTERFAHADGRARMIAVTYRPAAETPGGDFPFSLTTGRVIYHYLSGNQTRRLGFLNSQAPEPWVEMHPTAAARLGIANEEVVRVRTPRGAMELRALVTPTIRPDTLFIPFHYGHRQAVNQLTNSAVDPTVKIPEFKCCAAMIEKLGAPSAPAPSGATENFTAGNAPAMFPYQVAQPAVPSVGEGALRQRGGG